MAGELLQTAVAAARVGGEVLLGWFGRDDLPVEAKAQHDVVTPADRESEERIVELLRRRHPDHAILAEEGSGGGDGGAGAAGPRAPSDDAVQWFVDPLDGTTNFVQKLPNFCVSVGCRRGARLEAVAILDPLAGRLFTAERGGGAWLRDRRSGDRRLRVSSRPGLDGAFLATGYPFRARDSLEPYLELFRAVFQRARALRRCGAAGMDLAWTAAGVYDGFFEFFLSPWDLAAGALLVREAGGLVTDLDGGDEWLFRGHVLAGPPGVHGGLRQVAQGRVDEASLASSDRS